MQPGRSCFSSKDKWVILSLGGRRMFCSQICHDLRCALMCPLSAGIHHERRVNTFNFGCNTNITFFVSTRRFQLSPNWSISLRQRGYGRAQAPELESPSHNVWVSWPMRVQYHSHVITLSHNVWVSWPMRVQYHSHVITLSHNVWVSDKLLWVPGSQVVADPDRNKFLWKIPLNYPII